MGKRGQRYKRETNKQTNDVNLDQSEPWGFAATLGTEIRKRWSVPCLRIIIHAFTMASGCPTVGTTVGIRPFLMKASEQAHVPGMVPFTMTNAVCVCVTTCMYGVSICVSVCVCVRCVHIYVLECVWCACVWYMNVQGCVHKCGFMWVCICMYMTMSAYLSVNMCVGVWGLYSQLPGTSTKAKQMRYFAPSLSI